MVKEYPFYNGKTLFMSDDVFKLTTDTVLLSAFVKAEKGQRGIDLGSGSGALALLVMLRNPGVAVDGIDIVPEAAALARKNYRNCGFEGIACVTEGDYACIDTRQKYDFCVCNPPYFPNGSGIKSRNKNISTARHGEIGDVCLGASRVLNTGGKLFVCLPPHRLEDLCRSLLQYGFSLKRLRMVHETAYKKASLLLAQATLGSRGCEIEPPLILKDAAGYTKEYTDIYGTW